MVGGNEIDAGLTVEEVKRWMFEALNRYKIEAEKSFNQETCMNAPKTGVGNSPPVDHMWPATAFLVARGSIQETSSHEISSDL